MEYGNGFDLEFVEDRRGPLSVSLAGDWMFQAARGLSYAHN